MDRRPVVLVSMCLMGVNCRYDGKNSRLAELDRLMERCELLPVCPEQLGGLPTPRAPSERSGDRVRTRDGADVTEAFLRGAEEACQLAERFSVRHALLKSASPSCGSREIHDGSFTGRRVPGPGVTAQALRAMGVKLYGEDECDRMTEDLECDRP